MLIIRRGTVLASGDDFDPLLEYAAEHKTTVTEVNIWRYERSVCGELAVYWADGALGIFTSDDWQNLYEYARTVEGWPEPIVYDRPLPAVGLLFRRAPEEAPAEPEVTEAPVVRRRRRAVEEAEVPAEAEVESVPIRRSRARESDKNTTAAKAETRHRRTRTGQAC